jgi:hypothetical protein
VSNGSGSLFLFLEATGFQKGKISTHEVVHTCNPNIHEAKAGEAEV